MFVTTIIPTYNSEITLAQAIDSALGQEIDGHEVIVVNDGSTDGTAALLDSYANRIRTVNQSNRGFNSARNAAISIARGKYIAFLDADDIWLPGHLANGCAALERNSSAVLAFTDVIPMDERGKLGPPWVVGSAPSMNDLLTRGWRIYPSAVIMRQSELVACGGFNERLPNLSDAYLWLCARERGEFEYLAEPLVIYRVIDFHKIADKYANGFDLFAKAVRHRYGRAALPLTRELNGVFASSMIAKALTQTKHGEMLTACATLARAAWRSPRYMVQSGLARRLFSPRNLGRMFRTAGSSSDVPR